jgi:hypothetical protein
VPLTPEEVAHGWPGYTEWQPEAEAHNALERLADVARHEWEVGWTTGAVAEPSPPEARAALAAIVERLVAEEVPQRLAEYAVTSWLLIRGTVAGAVRFTARPIGSGPPPVPRLMRGPR